MSERTPALSATGTLGVDPSVMLGAESEVEETDAAAETDVAEAESVVETASPAIDTAAARAATVAEDAALMDGVRQLLASLSADPAMFMQIAQNWLRDQGLDARELGAASSREVAEVGETLARAAQEAAIEARESAAEANLIGQIFGWIGTGIAVAVSAVGAVFTGGAALALGVAAVACMIAAQTVSVLGQEGIIDDPAVAQGVSLGLSIVGTALSLGASSAGSAAQGGAAAGSLAAQVLIKDAMRVALEVANVVRVSLQVTSAVVGVGAGITAMVASYEEYLASGHDREGVKSELSADRARDDADENVDGYGSIMRQARRMAEAMARVREAESDSASAAIMRV